MGNQPQTKLEELARERNRKAMDNVLKMLRRERDQLFTAHISEGLDTVGVIAFVHKLVRNLESAMYQLGFFVPPDEHILEIRRTLGSALNI